MKRILLLLAGLTAVTPLPAHELLSVALHLEELSPGLVQITQKTPLARDGGPVSVVPRFDGEDCRPLGAGRAERQADRVLRQWRMHCAGGLPGQQLRLEGLDPRTPDAVVTAEFANGQQMTVAVDRHDPVVRLSVNAAAGSPGLAGYLPIGIEHILLGPDHLLFVLGLMLVVYVAGGGPRRLVAAITAFTLAHSLTLALATLGLWGLPPKAVELLIALSIVLLALELATQNRRADRGLPPSLTLRKPWLVAFAFGLLHGFGFAGALSEIGLPEQARGWALFLFNAGVEIGQLLFVLTVWLMLRLAGRIYRQPLPAQAPAVLVTVLGGVAMYWTLDRLLLWSAALWVGA